MGGLLDLVEARYAPGLITKRNELGRRQRSAGIIGDAFSSVYGAEAPGNNATDAQVAAYEQMMANPSLAYMTRLAQSKDPGAIGAMSQLMGTYKPPEVSPDLKKFRGYLEATGMTTAGLSPEEKADMYHRVVDGNDQHVIIDGRSYLQDRATGGLRLAHSDEAYLQRQSIANTAQAEAEYLNMDAKNRAEFTEATRQSLHGLPDLFSKSENLKTLLADMDAGKFKNTGWLKGLVVGSTTKEGATFAQHAFNDFVEAVERVELAPFSDTDRKVVEAATLSLKKDASANKAILMARIAEIEGVFARKAEELDYMRNNNGDATGMTMFLAQKAIAKQAAANEARAAETAAREAALANQPPGTGSSFQPRGPMPIYMQPVDEPGGA